MENKRRRVGRWGINCRKGLILQQISGRLLNLHSWRYSKLDWKKLWATWYDFEASPALNRRLNCMISRDLSIWMIHDSEKDNSHLKYLHMWLCSLVWGQRVYKSVCSFLKSLRGKIQDRRVKKGLILSWWEVKAYLKPDLDLENCFLLYFNSKRICCNLWFW